MNENPGHQLGPISNQENALAAPWTDELQTDPLRILVNRLRQAATTPRPDGTDHLWEVADQLCALLNERDSKENTQSFQLGNQAPKSDKEFLAKWGKKTTTQEEGQQKAHPRQPPARR